ncbi:carbon-nitrogen hydrolase family protein [Pontibacter sp. JAM-7]|uniref:carbon-nitrogen hydrolase family protein n=1 Tax=Pontibacter sp. JAM-7 TaxID=3366581 RepID=UPI003AF835C9
MRVAALQMVSTADLEKNLQQAAGLVQQAAEQGATLLLLPENFALLESAGLLELAHTDSRQQQIHATLADWSRCYGITVVAGSLPVARRPDGSFVQNRVRARCLVFDPQGNLQASYDKIHLFDVDVADAQGSYRESDLIEPGETLQVVKLDRFSLGLSICYDLRFPELYQRLREQGADLLMMPAAFTYATGEAHWECLIRARAIETQSYMLAANQGGCHSKTRRTWGHSMIVDPWGRILAEQIEDGPGVVVADLDPALVRQCRTQMPLLDHRNQAGC